MIIYKATNTISGKAYIGITENLHKRRIEHKCLANRGFQFHFYKAIRKYGFDSFNWEILEECDDRKSAANREIELIVEHDTFDNGYNGTKGGDGGFKAAHTEETKKKISQGGMGNTNRKGHIPANKGKRRYYNLDGSCYYK